MKILVIFSTLLIFMLTINAAGQTKQFSYEIYDRLTRAYVDDRGLVNYKELKKELNTLSTFIDQLAAVSPENHPEMFASSDEEKRYYLTAYNALVLYFSAAAYPDHHVLWSKLGYFKDKEIVLGGKKLSLNTLEHEIIRKKFLDPRIHFYINCGAKSCPLVKRGAINENLTDQELDSSARSFINSTDNVRFDSATGTLYLSKIFDWYSNDFINYLKAKRGIENPHITQYLALYLDEPTAKAIAATPLDQIKVKYLSYDKNLNEQ